MFLWDNSIKRRNVKHRKMRLNKTTGLKSKQLRHQSPLSINLQQTALPE
ncbi:hypothetical protein S1OALGB6SA_1525 [Olavius algarvensis spirochete endosymbiont]|nr:hypothetical protein S1OALGB6SA_1525 [Olavius algarvensis spirochete endosymbiont]